jgi:hypothetical protein
MNLTLRLKYFFLPLSDAENCTDKRIHLASVYHAMSPILLIIFGIPLLSLIWWIWADIRWKKAGISRGVRAIFSLAVLMMLSGFCWIILVRRAVISTPVPEEIYAPRP